MSITGEVLLDMHMYDLHELFHYVDVPKRSYNNYFKYFINILLRNLQLDIRVTSILSLPKFEVP